MLDRSRIREKKAKNGGIPRCRGSREPPTGRDTVRGRKMNITLPSIINGQTMPGGVDRYRYQAHKGQHLVVAVSAGN